MFIAFECFYSKSYGVLDKNYPRACLRGVFANKLRYIFLTARRAVLQRSGPTV